MTGPYLEIGQESIEKGILERAQKGGVAVSKVLTTTNDKEEGDVNLAGLRYVVVNNSDNPVLIDGVSCARGQIVAVLTTDTNGNAQTANNLLPYGDYIVNELRRDAANPSVGDVYANLYKGVSIYASIPGRDDVIWKEGRVPVEINAANTLFYASEVNDRDITNMDSHGNLTIQKQDAETTVAQGNASLASIRYAVINRSQYKVIYNGTTFAPNRVIDILTTDSNGRASTANKSMPYGTYEVVELPVNTTNVVIGNVYNASQLGSSIYANNNGYLYQAYNEVLSIREDEHTIEFENEDFVLKGGIRVSKVLTSTNDKQEGDTSLEGLRYVIVNDSTNSVLIDGVNCSRGQIVAVLTTDINGNANTPNQTLPYGRYIVYELRRDAAEPIVGGVYTSLDKGTSIYASPEGRDDVLWKETAIEVVIDTHNTMYYAFEVNDRDITNRNAHGNLTIQKLDAEHEIKQGDANLSGIRYAFVNRSQYKVVYNGTVYAPGQVIDILTTDANGRTQTALQSMPYGTYGVVELPVDTTNVIIGQTYDSSQLGSSIYANNNGYLYQAFDETKSVRTHNETLEFSNEDEVVRGRISVTKFDAETDLQEPQGAGTFVGIKYAIVNRSLEEVVLNGEVFEPGEVVEVLTLDNTGKALSSALAYGTYEVYELRKDSLLVAHDIYNNNPKQGVSIYSNDSYLHTDDIQSADISRPETYTVTNNRHRIRVQDEVYNGDYKNFPVRGDIELNKYDIDGYPDPYIPFLVSLLDVNGNKIESHVIITDADGFINTKTRNNKSELTVNTLDQYASNGIYNGPLNDEAASVNIWFGITSWAMNSRGSALYGNYLIEELQCENNLGQDMLTLEVAVSREQEIFKPDNVAIDLNIIIESQALDVRSDSNAISLGVDTIVQDTVQFTHLKIYNTYEVVAELVNVKKDGTMVSVGFSDPYMFVPDKVDDTNTSYATLENPLVIQFTINTSELEPGSYVAIVNRLYYVNDEGERILIKTHNEDCNVETQKLLVPDMTSRAHDFTTDSRIGALEPNSIVADYVSYSNFGNKVFYTLVEELFYLDGTPVLDINGNEAKAEVRLYVDYRNTDVVLRNGIFIGGKNGELLMPKFELDSSNFNGKTIAIKQTLLDEVTREVVLVHNDLLNQEDQNIRWLDIRTVAGSTTGVQGIVPCDENVTIVDTLTYENCAEDTDVKVKMIVVEKETKNIVAESIAEKSLAVDNGTLQTSVTFNTLPYEGKQLVVFEYVYKVVNGEDVLIARHEDINDTNQTVMIPKIRTVLESVIDGNRYKSMKESGVITLVDTVTYENLKVGQSYTFVAELMNKSTGANVLDKDGNKVTGSTTIVPESTSGSVEVEMTFEVEDSLATAWENVDAYVAFEEVWGNSDTDNLRYAFHKDLDDEDQTVIVPKIRTTALGKDSESKNVISKNNQVVVDKVELKDFHLGDTLTLVIVAHDPVTGNALLDSDGNKFTNSKTFVYEGQEFELIECEIDAADLGGKNVVFFEYVHIGGEVKDETVIAYEDDQNNFKQTVRIPTGYTNALDLETGIQLALAKELKVLDIVTYKNVEPNRTYKLVGELVDKETQEVVVTAEKEVLLTTEDGEIELVFEFDVTEFEGRTVVAFETLYELNGTAIFEHKDINDEAQSIHIPKIRTEANAEDTEIKVTGAKTTTVIKDIVTYSNLIADGREYRVEGHLVDKSNGNPILLDGNKITASTEFVPTSPDGEVEIVFEFDSSALAGTTIVIFEDLFFEDVLIAVHADIEDDNQTVYIPKIRTKVFDENTLLDHTLREEVVTIVDTVSYTNLLPSVEYTVTGKLMNKLTGEPILVNGEEVISSTTFTPEEESGVVEVKFTFDASDLIGTTLVAFEKLFYNNIEIANHEDLTDEDQTEYIPNISTEALGGSTSDHVELASENTTIIDIVTYEGLKPHTKYEVKGKLMDQETGEPILVNGEEVTSSVTFVTGEADEDQVSVSGEIELVFTFDARELAGKAVVVFEDLYHEDKLVAVHADINDESQTVYLPKVETEARDKFDGDQTIDGTQTEQVIVDKVIYSGLLVGKEYTVKGYLVNKATGEKVVDSEGNVITASTTFIAEESDGELELEFVVDGTMYAGKKLVAFESLYYEDVLVGIHADIDDEDQTVGVSLLLDVRIAKADAENIKYFLKGAEITVFNADGTIAKDINGNDCVGLTDENGQIQFTLLYDEDNIFYVQETKAPAGYHINNDKFEVRITGEDQLGVDLIKISVLDKAIVIPPPTGENVSPLVTYGLIAIAAAIMLFALSMILYKRRKDEEQKIITKE